MLRSADFATDWVGSYLGERDVLPQIIRAFRSNPRFAPPFCVIRVRFFGFSDHPMTRSPDDPITRSQIPFSLDLRDNFL
jgi:hypothetical protein